MVLCFRFSLNDNCFKELMVFCYVSMMSVMYCGMNVCRIHALIGVLILRNGYLCVL